MDNKVMRQLNRAMQPALTDISIDWSSLEAHMTPFRQPPLFIGGRMVVYGFVDSKNASKAEITLNAKTALGPYQTKVTFDPQNAKDGTHIHKLATRSMIKDLEDKRSYLHDNAFNMVSGIPESAVKDEMVRLSKKYGVLCAHTAFIAVEERDVATEGTMQIRKGAAASITKAKTKAEMQKLSKASAAPVLKPMAPSGKYGGFGGRGGGGGCRGRGRAPPAKCNYAASPSRSRKSNCSRDKCCMKEKCCKRKKKSGKKGFGGFNCFKKCAAPAGPAPLQAMAAPAPRAACSCSSRTASPPSFSSSFADCAVVNLSLIHISEPTRPY
eukprot:TRINITY_DN1549_c0_g1_i2.p1 TRINITY_DN1549_c0_g1~~TRINITY_DN1549_c0_g1_i2.p1  ORF type:complete len:376 (-),score=52.34 TRINITY_DN1549_c0_g1_i2:20-994(-)